MTAGDDGDDTLSVALALARALDAAGISYAIGGALAYSIWAVPRATLAVDINVFLDDADLPRLGRCLAGLGITVDDEILRQQSEAAGLIVVRWRGLRVDLFTPSIPFSREAEKSRAAVTIDNERYWFLSREALAVFKLLFYRPKDLADLAQLVATRGTEMDTGYVRSAIAEMLGDDERIARWDAIVASRGRSV